MDTLKHFLDSNHYEYTEKKENLIVKLNSVQEVTLSKSTEGNLKFEDRFTGWNFLSGFIQMSLSNALKMNLIILGLFVVLALSVNYFNNITLDTYIILFGGVYLLFFGLFAYKYSKKLKSFETQVRSISELAH